MEVLLAKRRAGATVLVCAGGACGSVTLPESWTGRGEPPGTGRLSAGGARRHGGCCRGGARWPRGSGAPSSCWPGR